MQRKFVLYSLYNYIYIIYIINAIIIIRSNNNSYDKAQIQNSYVIVNNNYNNYIYIYNYIYNYNVYKL